MTSRVCSASQFMDNVESRVILPYSTFMWMNVALSNKWIHLLKTLYPQILVFFIGCVYCASLYTLSQNGQLGQLTSLHHGLDEWHLTPVQIICGFVSYHLISAIPTRSFSKSKIIYLSMAKCSPKLPMLERHVRTQLLVLRREFTYNLSPLAMVLTLSTQVPSSIFAT